MSLTKPNQTVLTTIGVTHLQVPQFFLLSGKIQVFVYHFAFIRFHYVVLFTNPSARAGYDTRSIFKRSLTGLNSEFSFS